MDYGFDLDDTITAEPDSFRELMGVLVSANHGVHVISGALDDGDPEAQRQKLDGYGFVEGTHYTSLDVVVARGAKDFARGKRELCEHYGVSLVFEDRSDYANEISKVARCLMMWPRAN